MDGRYDDLLLGLAQKHRGIEDILYTVMSFYERKTDLFHVKDSPDDKKGFKAGEAEDMIKKQFNHFQARYLERAQPHLLARRPSGSSGGYSGAAPSAALARAAGVGAAGSGEPSDAPRAAGGGDAAAGGGGGPDAGAGGGAPSAPSRPAPKAKIPDGVEASPLEGGDPGQWARQSKAVDMGRKWNQSPTEVNVEIDVEKCTKNDIKVVLASRKVSVKRKDEVILEGNFFDKINVEESTWHLSDGKQVVLSLEKIRPAYWEGLLEGEGAVPVDS
eukprot:TRINITY_DN44821_c0_g1_i1.p1 TRINITY_DN44821_c0_g1~~TRINITY_DN44821_c0_g1_i1.p1  ORF type:complete len:273 (+),score=74.07 TRINITY_DN44821_c0_g1_i1:119-937(+)